MKILTCTCGKKSSELNGNESVGQERDKTGFGFVPTFEGEIIWLCPDCYSKAHALALEIQKIVKNEMLYFATLLEALPQGDVTKSRFLICVFVIIDSVTSFML